MNDVSAPGSRSVLKAYVLFVAALFVAVYAWWHGGWIGLFSIFILAPLYFAAVSILCGTEQYLMRKYPQFVPADKIRIPFVIIVVMLAAQVLITPALADGPETEIYWSIFTGLQRSTGQPQVFNFAVGFYLTSNLLILAALVIFLVFVIQDFLRRKKRRD